MGVKSLTLIIVETGKKALDKDLSLVLCLVCNNDAVLNKYSNDRLPENTLC